MKENIVDRKDIFELLKTSNHFIIPFYQREYTWQEKEITRLLKDILDNKAHNYYLGTIIAKWKRGTLSIIDGQQRITTILLICKALTDSMRRLDSKKVGEIEEYCKVKIDLNNLENGQYLKSILEGRIEKIHDLNLINNNYLKNWKYFENYFSRNQTINSLELFLKQLKKIFLATVFVDEEVNEFDLFEQINSTGKKLSQFDLTRNFILSKLSDSFDNKKESKEKIINESVAKINKAFYEFEKEKEASNILRHFIASLTYKLPKKAGNFIFEDFKKLEEFFANPDEWLSQLCIYANYYHYLINWKNKKEANHFQSLRIINESFQSYAVLLVDILKNHSSWHYNQITFSEKQLNEIEKCFKIIEAFIIKRLFCNRDPKVLTRYIPTIPKLINKIKHELTYAEKLLYVIDFASKNQEEARSYEMPDQNEFEINFKILPIYNNSKNKFCKLLIERLSFDKYSKNEHDDPNLSIEHIFPINHENWINEYKWDENTINEMNKRLHTIGNLTLLVGGVNSKNSNKLFSDKIENLYKHDNFLLNNYLRNLTKWDVEEIDKRAHNLLEKLNDLLDLKDLYKKLEKIIAQEGDLIEAKELEKSAKIDYEFKKGNRIMKNLNYFKKIGKMNFDDIENILHCYYVENLSQERIEMKMFNQSFNGWVVHSIFSFLEIIGKSNKIKISYAEFKKLNNQLQPKIAHLIEFIEESVNND